MITPSSGVSARAEGAVNDPLGRLSVAQREYMPLPAPETGNEMRVGTDRSTP